MKAEVTIRRAARGGRGAEPRLRSGLRPPMVLAVAGIHIGFITALCLLLHAQHLPPQAAEISIPVVFAPAVPQAEPTPQMLASSMLPVPSSTEIDSLAPLPSMTLPAARLGELPRISPRKPPRDRGRTPPEAASPASVTQALPPSPSATHSPEQRMAAPAPAASPLATEHALASWEARIRQAVQDAAIYPASARLLHRDGRAQVRFDYDRGAVARAKIVQSSHFDALDNAALAAVTRAAIPAPPAELGPQDRTLLVWVQFKLETEE